MMNWLRTCRIGLLILALAVVLPLQADPLDFGSPDGVGQPAEAYTERAQSGLSGLLTSLGLGGDTDEFLHPDEAFALTVSMPDGETVFATWHIADGYYLYRDRFAFELQDGDGVTLGTPEIPSGEIKEDSYFGRQEVYFHSVVVRLPVHAEGAELRGITLKASYQGCADGGICYPPMDKTVALTPGAGATGLPGDAAESSAGTPTPVVVSEQDRIASLLQSAGPVLTVASFFGFGLLLAFTPCVFPMIPILSSIIVGQGTALSTRRAFLLSLVYVLAMAATYTVAGVVAGLFGANLQATFQNPWILITFAAVFVLLALSMFGFYKLQVPARLQSRLAELSNRQRGGTVAGVGAMGFFSALIVGPCVAAPLAGALTYIGQTGDAVLGGTALFALSMGMGTPLLVLGSSAGSILPRIAPWMRTIQAVFGVLMLGVAIWLLERILPGEVTLLLWAGLLIGSAIAMGVLRRWRFATTGWHKPGRVLGFVFLGYGLLLAVAAGGGGKDPLRPLHGVSVLAGNADRTAEPLPFRSVKGLEDVQREIEQASSSGLPVMLDLYADWCLPCKQMERYTFSDPGVQQALAGVVLLKADVTPWDGSDQELTREFGLYGPPGILFFGPNGEERRAYRVVGFMDAPTFKAHVERALR